MSKSAANTARTGDKNSIRCSPHAPLRYLQRVDATEAFPGDRLLEMYDRARWVDRPDVEGSAYLDDRTGTVLVVDEQTDEIVTVLYEVPQ